MVKRVCHHDAKCQKEKNPLPDQLELYPSLGRCVTTIIKMKRMKKSKKTK